MKSELANKLKEILENMSQEQFDQEWSQITALELEGPSFADAIEYFSVSIDKMGKFELNSKIQNEVTPTINYLAA
ncbi:hypothetical protein [uncultured Flavobacterium sp.]|uniref:hypothetical protein n=1 Tax=uncultured Flavobacterium sp. TaxID=165435 RepID=UPI0030EDFB29|tara:strand:- start:61069 stop:61293 length:225 start_codon:yes stop_codon:yes gene_type:complete